MSNKINGFNGFNLFSDEFRNDSLLLQNVIAQFLKKHDLKGIRAILNGEILNFSIARDSVGVESWKND